jgi:hypothetical protein
MSGEFNAEGIWPGLQKAYDLTENPEARNELNRIASWINRVNAQAKREEDPEVKRLREQIRKSNQTRDDERRSKANEEYQSETSAEVQRSTERVISSFLKGRTIPDNDRKQFLEIVRDRTTQALSQDKQFTEQRDKIASSGNKDALKRFVTNAWEKKLQQVVPNLTRLLNPGTKQGPGQKPPVSQSAGKRQVKTQANFVRGPVPNYKDIDYSKTTNEMTRQHRAVLKNGTRVDWSAAL